VTLRFYAELNDLLPPGVSREVECPVVDAVEVGTLIEECGVPLSEVDLIIVGGESVGRRRRVGPGDRAGVYPVFESFDISPEARLRHRPLRRTGFAVTSELVGLADLLRAAGYEVAIGEEAPAGDSIRLTTDVARHPDLSHVLAVVGDDPAAQFAWVVDRLHLGG
jgi:hypothetical protein